VLGLGATEVALRVYDLTRPSPLEAKAELWEPARGFGWLHRPGASGRWFDQYGEFSVDVTINSEGLRDVEHEREKPPGVFRILLLGDSYMEGIQVELEKTFPRLLERKLSARRVEVINASTADWGTDNQLVYFRERGRAYSPDLVLLAFTTANDVRNNSVELNLRVPSALPFKPTFTMSATGELEFHEMPPLPPSPPAPPWWRASRAATFFERRLGLTPPVIVELPPAAKPAASPTAATPLPPVSRVPTDMLVYSPSPPAEVTRAWAVTKALVLELEREVEAGGAAFAMVLVNGPWAHYDDYWKLMTMDDPTARASWDPQRPNREMAAFAAERSIPALDLFQAIEAEKLKERLYFRYDPHFTAAGHRVAANATAAFLVEKGLVPAAR
jgi:hypothetical protein